MDTKDNSNSALYYEPIILRLLADMGYLNQKALNKTAEIAPKITAQLSYQIKFIISEQITLNI